MAVKFIIDSGADILPAECAKLDIIHLPLKVIFGQQEYNDAVDLSHREFYEKLVESDIMPTTSQVPLGDFADACQQVAAAGDTAVIVTISGKLSGTYQAACIAASEYPDRIFVVDSESVSLGTRILVQHGLALREQGVSAREIAQQLDIQKKKIRVMALVDTLEYLKKGGRISATVAIAGSLLSIKPVIAIEDGAVAMVGKARGSRQGNNLLRQLIEKCGGINFTMPFCLAYSGLSDALLQKYIADSAELWQGYTAQLPIATVGCTIGAHAGPGAVAVAFFEN
jgi:DegV family protein with EDD domain